MVTIITNPYLCSFLRYLLATIFLFSAYEKLRQPQSFISSVRAYRILPLQITQPFAISLTWVELFVGLFFLVGWYVSVIGLLSALLFVLFGIAIAINLLRKQPPINCGCFGNRHQQKVSGKLLLRDFLLLVCSLMLVVSGGGYWSLDTQTISVQHFILKLVIGNVIAPLLLSILGIYMIRLLLLQLKNLLSLMPWEK